MKGNLAPWQTGQKELQMTDVGARLGRDNRRKEIRTCRKE